MAKWGKVLLTVVVGLGIFVGVTAFVYDLHFLDDTSAEERYDACVAPIDADDALIDVCLSAFERDLAENSNTELLIGAGCGALAAGLFWLLAYLFFFRRRRLPERPV